jgi:hypothetical protein
MRRDDHGIIGSPPAVDLGPLFAQPTLEEATQQLRDFSGLAPADPAPAPRAREETGVFDAPEALGERERLDRIARIKREILEPLTDLARARRNHIELPGVTAQDARSIADARGLAHLLGHEQRAWSWLAAWLGQICREGALNKYRLHGMTMKRMGDNGNEHVIYLDPYDFRASREVAA